MLEIKDNHVVEGGGPLSLLKPPQQILYVLGLRNGHNIGTRDLYLSPCISFMVHVGLAM
ncbi:hypothetical protein Lalb_Chr12g0201811 [Lupinus albus]|uniref:Uncharacterized protein n=1 Tax=Lupinus albus TaxID=3870 RepID=A0A6A4PMI9_LUPAL|nr:hypothetical protein Lalb_Chr12g0201811 [Lupinus albus]